MNNNSTEKHRGIECPHCHNQIRVTARLDIISAVLSGEDASFVGLEEKERAVFKNAKDIGLIDAFAIGVSYAKGLDAPRNMEAYFLTFLRTANARRIPRFAMGYFLETFGNGEFQFWQGQGTGAIIIDDVVRAFIPLEVVIGPTAKSTDNLERTRVGDATREGIEEWIGREGVKLTRDQFVSFSRLRKCALDSLLTKI